MCFRNAAVGGAARQLKPRCVLNTTTSIWRHAILLAGFLFVSLAFSASADSAGVPAPAGEDTIDRALNAVALQRADLRVRPDLSRNPYAIPAFLRWISNPLSAPREVQRIALRLFETTQEPTSWLRELAESGGMTPPAPLTLRKCSDCVIPEGHPEALRKALDLLLDAMYTSNLRLAALRASIPAERMKSIEQFLYPDFLRDAVDPTLRNETLHSREVKEALGSAGSLERMAVLEAALTLLDALSRASELLAGSPVLGEIRSFSFESPIGLVEVGGKGHDIHSRDAALIVDLGGDDQYLGRAAGGTDGRCALVLDLEGNDLYLGEDFTQGSGFWGVGILMDLKGNDLYKAGDCSQGSGLFGVGLLIDSEGSDRYLASRFVQAASAWGLGGLLDLSGEDVYECHTYGQAYSGVLGVSCLCDLAGNDRYLSGLNAPDPREPEMNQSFSQGFSMGMRSLAAGGFSLLADKTGNDFYQCQYFGQGASYWMGIGLLYDHRGNDIYVARRYAQGAGIHYSLGILIDAGGDDHTASWGVSQGCGHDYGTGILINYSGNDTYVSDWLSTGASEANGIGIFVDTSGNDGYEVRSGMGTGHLAESRRSGGIGLFVDAGGKDRYSVKGADNKIWMDNRWAVGVDENEGWLRDLDLAGAGAPVGETTGTRVRQKEPTVKELPSSGGIEALFAAATTWGMDEEASRQAREEFLQMDPTVSVPFLAGLLDTPDVVVLLFMEKFFTYHSFHSVPYLVGKTKDPNPEVRTAALFFLSRIKDPAAMACSRAALHDSDRRARAVAVRAIGEIMDRERLRELLLLEDALKASPQGDDLGPMKEYTREKTYPLVLSVLASSVPLKNGDHRFFDVKKPEPDFFDIVGLHRRQMLRLLERWIMEMNALGESTRETRNELGHPDPAIRKAAAYTLGQLRDISSIGEIASLLSDPESSVRDSAVLALALFGEAAVPYLKQVLDSQKPSLMILSLDALSRIRSEAAKDLILQYTHHSDGNVKRMADLLIGR